MKDHSKKRLLRFIKKVITGTITSNREQVTSEGGRGGRGGNGLYPPLLPSIGASEGGFWFGV